MDDHLGSAKHDPARRDGGNSRNGTRTKQLLTDVGPVEVAIPRDRDGSFEPQIVGKRQRRLSGIDGLVISLSAKGLTHGEIAAHLAEVYDAQVSKQTISTITDRVIEGMSEWQNRPLDPGQSLADVANLRQEMSDATWRTEPRTGAGQAVVL
jgi:putative transposase